ncbi:hypothetical protein KUTeg_011191 [Tegillarca granosa]|uniref:Zinc-hook domain-containing protein n=1 Tax=Tegillarca granosa TaxID=220873 RepID=A0ABQ9F1J0_TEGGR|nr:hypothetical protein KUTeg_011191 [Tegillarca granosa]
MSLIEEMSIQGIRSFGPDDGNKQIIEFFNPLTLILGPNGTGKTTVIECLKYMTTGVMPPGSIKGGAFIHDPKIAHEREVKGQIRLQFRDVSSQKCVVQRIMMATQKAKRIEMKTLDGVITRLDAAGEKKSISSKCAEIDREMITSLGVSKPVLENVIFCHQEDSNWPLSEGKNLKEKFDAIFASTRYVKALEAIRKLKQTQDQSLKLYKQDISYLKQHKEKAAQLDADLNEYRAQLSASKDSVEKVTHQLQPIEDKLTKINEKANELFKIETEITKYTSEKNQMVKATRELQDSIENEFQGSTEELKRVLQEFQAKVEERGETLDQFEQRQSVLTREMEKLGKERNSLLLEVGKLEQEAQTYDENVRKRDALIRQLADNYNFEGFNRGEITDEKYKNFLENIETKQSDMVEEGKTLKADFEEKERDIQDKIDKMRDNKSKLEQSIHMKNNMMKENTDKIRNINKKLSEVEASAGKLDQLNRDLRKEEHELKTVEENVDVDKLKKEIADLANEKSKNDLKISDLNSEISRLHLQSSEQAKLDVIKKDKASKEENIKRIKSKQEDTITYLMGHMPTANIRDQLEDYIDKQSSLVKKVTQELQKTQTQLSSKEAEKKMTFESLKKQEDELKNLEEKIFTVCGSQDFDDGLSVLNEKIEKSQDQRGSLMGAEYFFKKYVDDLEKEEPCCPLCHREFDTGQEVKELILELRNKLRQVPAKLNKTETDLDEYKQKYDAMMQLKPLKENIKTLEEKEIPDLKTKLKKINEEIEKFRNIIQEKEEDKQAKETDEEMAKEIHPDIVTMDRYQGEVTELDKKIATQSAALSGGGSGRSLQGVINEKEELQMQVDTVSRKLEHKKQKVSDHSEEVQRLKGNINTITSEKLRIESDLQQRIKLEEEKENLKSYNDRTQKEVQDSTEELKPIQTKLTKLRSEKEEITQNKEAYVDQIKNQVDGVKNNGIKVRNINQDIKVYVQAGKAETLIDKKEKHDRVNRKMEKLETESGEMTENIDKLRNDIATQRVRERELVDNLQLRKKQEEIQNVEVKIKELEDKLGGVEVTNMERERKRLLKQQEELIKEKHNLIGRQTGIEDMIRNARRELNSDMYKDASTKYRDQMIMLRTTELANSDLEKYYKALDRAIMSYHNLKMTEINKIIRDLWRNTYRGNDIETIEIRSDEEDGSVMKARP